MSREKKVKTDSSEAGQALRGAAPIAQGASGGPVSAAEPLLPLLPGSQKGSETGRGVALSRVVGLGLRRWPGSDPPTAVSVIHLRLP